MPFFLLVVGIILLTVVIRGNQDQLITLLKSDFTGSNNFILWILAFVFLIAIGYWKTIRPVSDTFIILILVVMFVYSYKNQDIFNSFISQIKEGTSSNG